MSSTSEALRVETPAQLSHVLELAPSWSRLRRFHVYQARLSESVAIFDGEELVCVAILFPEGDRIRELCPSFGAGARRRMLALVRIAQLMIRPLADSGVVVVCRIDPRNRPGRRMARAGGFLETDAESGRLWFWRDENERRR